MSIFTLEPEPFAWHRSNHALASYADFVCGGVIQLGLVGLFFAVKKAVDDNPRQLMSLGMVWLTQVL